MSWIDRVEGRDAEPGRLRSFGLIVGGMFALIALAPLVRHGEVRSWALTLSVALISAALVYARVLKPVYVVWMIAGDALGFVNTRVILALVFYVVLTPIGWLRRLARKDSIRNGLDSAVDSYRVVRQPRPGCHMTRQF